MGQDGPRGASRRPRPEQIQDIKETGQSRGAELGAGDQLRLNGPWPPPENRSWVIPKNICDSLVEPKTKINFRSLPNR